MSTLIGDYNLALIQVNLDGFRVTGWATDDACSIAKASDDFEMAMSVDGANATFSRINDNSYTVTFKLQKTSAGYKRVADAYLKQIRQADQGAVEPMAFSAYNPNNGDKIAERNGRFTKGPDLNFHKASDEATFVLMLPNPSTDYGANVSTSV